MKPLNDFIEVLSVKTDYIFGYPWPVTPMGNENIKGHYQWVITYFLHVLACAYVSVWQMAVLTIPQTALLLGHPQLLYSASRNSVQRDQRGLASDPRKAPHVAHWFSGGNAGS